MTTKQILNDGYEVASMQIKTTSGKFVKVYRAMTMKDLPRSFYKCVDPDKLCPKKPFKGLRFQVAVYTSDECNALTILSIHGSAVELYVCAILVRPCSKEAERQYRSFMGMKVRDCAGLMWDSRNFDSALKPKKKRVRATLRQVRSLSAEINDLNRSLEIAIGQCADKDARIKNLESAVTECNTLRKSNALMEEELKRLRGKLKVAEDGWREGKEEVERLMNRGFWARVFNM